ncbi:ricin-type beta-trefoil lectin domain protein [Streptomyces sp. URMC 126]|uniref:ricin-type beta-trefoil lectin domain protein n=1 Tax=Streptomyces sp. URMC 126 TaxID=3423401 RepID=UPI003F1DDE74
MPAEERPAVDPARRLGNALRALQQRSGHTLRSLEEEMPISDSSLSRYFRGSTVPPWTTVLDLCRTLNGDPAEFRVLWEAADRGQSASSAEAGPDASGRTAGSWTGRLARTVRALPRGRLRGRLGGGFRGRWTYAVVGAVAGTLAGVVLTVLVLRPDALSTPGSGARVMSTAGKKGGDEKSGNGKGGDGKDGPGSEHGTGRSDGVRIFVSRATGTCLDDSLDYALRSYACNGMSYQRWTVHGLPDGSRQLRNHATGACLASDARAAPRATGCAASPGPAQRWTVTTRPDESVEVRNKATGTCLDDGGDAGLRLLPCDGGPRQKWG